MSALAPDLWGMGLEEAREALVFPQCAEAVNSQRPYSIFFMLAMPRKFALQSILKYVRLDNFELECGS